MVAICATAALTGCWTQPGGDSGGSYSSPWPTAITSANVGSLRPLFTASAGSDTSQPDLAVFGGTVFVTGDRLLAIDAAGQAGCSGQAPVCTPLWTSSDPFFHLLGPVVDRGRVWVTAGGKLLAYDAAGEIGCSGIPKTCTPVVATTVGTEAGVPVAGDDGIYLNAATFANGGFTHVLDAFDHNGVLRWSAPLGSGPEPEYVAPASAHGTVYAVSRTLQGQSVAAFDAAGINGCSGSPDQCLPLWTTDAVGSGINQIAVRAGWLYRGDTTVSVFDAAGVKRCTAGVCAPWWRTSTGGRFAVTTDTLVVAGNVSLAGYPLTGTACPGSLLLCLATWIGIYPDSRSGGGYAPTVAGDVAYVSLQDGIVAFSAHGDTSCTAATTRICSPLMSVPFSYAPRAPVVVGALAYVVRPIRSTPTGPERDVTALGLP